MKGCDMGLGMSFCCFPEVTVSKVRPQLGVRSHFNELKSGVHFCRPISAGFSVSL